MKTILHLTMAITLFTSLAHASSITINSGTNVTFLQEPFNTDFAAPFTTADFAAARAGASAIVQTSTPYWINSLPSAPAAEWIGTYAAQVLVLATLTLRYMRSVSTKSDL